MESRHSPATTHRCEAKIRAGGTCLVRVEPGKSRCRFHGVSTGPKTEQGRTRVAEPQQCRWLAYRASLSTKSVGDLAPADRLVLTHRKPLVRLPDCRLPT